jgi:hypothetical protein
MARRLVPVDRIEMSRRRDVLDEARAVIVEWLNVTPDAFDIEILT